MNLLPRRSLLAVAAVIDVAHHARPTPIAAKTLSARHGLPPRHLETLLQALVRAGILKGIRGPRGGYELARERRKITVGAIVRAALASPMPGLNGSGEGALADGEHNGAASKLIGAVVLPMIESASETFLAQLDEITVEELCRAAEERAVFSGESGTFDFSI